MRKGLSLAFVLGALVCCFSIPPAAGAGEEGSAPAPSRKMPKAVPLGRSASAFGPVRFDHAEHVDMAGGCAECHHQHGTADGIACMECHSLEAAAFRRAVRPERFRPCGECHPASFRPSEPSLPSLTAAYHRACFRCHGDMGGIGEDPKGCAETCHEKRNVENR